MHRLLAPGYDVPIEVSRAGPTARRLLGEGEGVRLERGMTMEDYEVRMETALRLIPQRRPPPHPSRERSAEALKELLALQDGLGRRWDELHISRQELQSRKRALAQKHAVQRGTPVKDRLKLTVGGEPPWSGRRKAVAQGRAPVYWQFVAEARAPARPPRAGRSAGAPRRPSASSS